ncbi:MAG: DUF2617 family protein [Phycisphaerae bacterium]|nr:DUF2617 family protein [Phycisphaerae bacterium]
MAQGERQVAAGDLRLSVFLRTVHPEFFTIRVGRAFEGASGRFRAEVWLLDFGHVITFVEGERAVTEVIAPKGLVLPKRGLVREMDLVGEREQRIEARGEVLYQMTYLVDAADAETYRRDAEELLAGARQAHLFAESPGDLAGRAFAYAVPELRATSLLVHAWHGFPAETTILKTQTLIERAEP